MALCSECDRAADHLVQLKSHCDSRPQDSRPHFGYQICMAAKKALASLVAHSGTTFASDRMPEIACRGRKPGRRVFGVEPIGVESVGRHRRDNHHVEKVDMRCRDLRGVGAAGQRG
jgi:hypothetical protein